MMFFYTYILLSSIDGNHYIGYTNNLKRRLEEHNAGKNFSTNILRLASMKKMQSSERNISNQLLVEGF